MFEIGNKEEKRIVIKTNEEDLVFTDPYISRQGFLTFKRNSLKVNEAEYSYEDKVILLHSNKHKYLLRLDEENISILDNLYKVEYDKINSFYKECSKCNINLVVSDNAVDTKEIIENQFNIYYLRVFEYTMNKIFKTKGLNYEALGKFILSKVDFTKYDKLNGYFVIPVRDVLSVL